jgi:segregation and condensation protein A
MDDEPPTNLDGAGDDDSPILALDGYAGPLARLLALARAQAIDLAQVPLPALLDQLAAALHAAGRPTTLSRRSDWLVLAAWLVLLRSRLLLPVETAQQAAQHAASQLRDRLLALHEAQTLAAWLERRPQLGRDAFPRGQPELPGTATEPAHQIDVIEFLWASMALFDDAPDAATATSTYRPPWRDLHSALEAQQRMLRLLAVLPNGASLDQFLPVAPTEDDISSRADLRRRSAWSSTFLASLELAKQGDVLLRQEADFQPIQVSPGGEAALMRIAS